MLFTQPSQSAQPVSPAFDEADILVGGAREEGGTPGIVESIRAGMVFGLKQAIGTDVI